MGVRVGVGNGDGDCVGNGDGVGVGSGVGEEVDVGVGGEAVGNSVKVCVTIGDTVVAMLLVATRATSVSSTAVSDWQADEGIRRAPRNSNASSVFLNIISPSLSTPKAYYGSPIFLGIAECHCDHRDLFALSMGVSGTESGTQHSYQDDMHGLDW